MPLMKAISTPDGGCEHVEMSAEEEAAIRAEWAANEAAAAASLAFTPAQIVAVFVAWGVGDRILSSLDSVTLARFYTAHRVLLTDPHLVAALALVGKSADDLKAQIAG